LLALVTSSVHDATAWPASGARALTRSERLCLGGALALPWLFIWQGLDFTDQGYLLTGYRCFFRYPEVTEDSGHIWLTNFVGASWDALFGGLGVLGMRALWALCMSLCVWLAFGLARALTTQRAAALATLVTSVFLSDRHATWFSYNALSTVIFTASAVALLRGLRQHSPRWLFAAGLLLGIAPFARFPNVLAWATLSAIGFAALIEPARRQHLARDVAAALLGVASGVALLLALICVRGDTALYWRGLRSLFEPSMAGAGYAVPSLLGLLVKDEGGALGWGLAVCIGALAWTRALRWAPAPARWPLIAAGCALALFVLTHKSESWRWAVPGASYFLLAGVALGLWQRTAEQRVAAFVLFIIVLVAPLGSNLGIKNAHMGLWLTLPSLLALLYTLEAAWLSGQGPRLALAAGVILCGEGMYRAATYTYRDSLRIQLRSAVDHPQLRGQYTSRARARSVEQVLAALEQRVAPGDYLLAYEGTPLLQYLTRTRPYLNRPWLMGWERGEVVTRLAAEAPARTGCLPVVVRTSRSARGFDWPEHAAPLETGAAQRGVRQALDAFLREHGYTLSWDNGYFQILEPEPTPAQRRPCR